MAFACEKKKLSFQFFSAGHHLIYLTIVLCISLGLCSISAARSPEVDQKREHHLFFGCVYVPPTFHQKYAPEINELEKCRELPQVKAIIRNVSALHGTVTLKIEDIFDTSVPAFWRPDTKTIYIDNRLESGRDFLGMTFGTAFIFEMANAANPYVGSDVLQEILNLCSRKLTGLTQHDRADLYAFLLEAAEFPTTLNCEDILWTRYEQKRQIEGQSVSLVPWSPKWYKPLEYFEGIDSSYCRESFGECWTDANEETPGQFSHADGYRADFRRTLETISRDEYKFVRSFLNTFPLVDAYLEGYVLLDPLLNFAFSQRAFWHHKTEVRLLKDAQVQAG